ncbi:DUF3576 domain-containing protein [Alphaproteobacteria bacterium]|nr:DUF3576 domain-containing protein [Alphaproteobacteria bacterium]
MTMFHRICKFTRFGRILSLSLGTTLLLSSCAGLKTTPVEQPEEPVSVITGKPGGLKLSDFGTKETSSGDSLPVNALLWRAALDIASFVPLDDVDTFGGSIVTEWHQPKETPNQRLKLTMFVIGRELRSDAITVRAYIQNRLGTEWVDAGRDEALGRKLENLVLARARELRAAATAETVN